MKQEKKSQLGKPYCGQIQLFPNPDLVILNSDGFSQVHMGLDENWHLTRPDKSG